MFMLQYQGEGHGFMAGKTEYVVMLADRPTDDDKESWKCHGFELTQVVHLDVVRGDPDLLPTEVTLVKSL